MIVTVLVHDLKRPDGSVNVSVTLLDPIFAQVKLDRLNVRVAMPQLSEPPLSICGEVNPNYLMR